MTQQCPLISRCMSETCQACYFHIRALRHIRASLTPEASSGSIVVTAYDSEFGLPGSNPEWGQYTMRLRSLHRAYPSLHPSGVAHWVPEQLNIKAVTGQWTCMLTGGCSLKSCVRPHFLSYATEIKSTQLHAALLWLGLRALNKCVVHLHLHSKTIAAAIAVSRLDFCNSLLAGTSISNPTLLQLVQAILARVVAQKPRFCHITPFLSDLHWLPVRHRISFKIATVTFRVQQFQQPSYLASLIPRYAPDAKTPLFFIFVNMCSPTWNYHSRLQIIFICRFGYLECTAESSVVHPNFFGLLEEFLNLIYSCLLTLTVMQSLVRSNQLNVSHFVIQCQLLPSQSPEIPYHKIYVIYRMVNLIYHKVNLITYI